MSTTKQSHNQTFYFENRAQTLGSSLLAGLNLDMSCTPHEHYQDFDGENISRRSIKSTWIRKWIRAPQQVES